MFLHGAMLGMMNGHTATPSAAQPHQAEVVGKHQSYKRTVMIHTPVALRRETTE